MIMYDDKLKKERGYVTKIPFDKRCVVITSGGIDSSVLILKLLEDGYEVFPLFIDRGQRSIKQEEAAVDLTSGYFGSKYDRYHAAEKVTISIPLKELKKELEPYMKEKGHPMRDPMMHNVAVQYAIVIEQRLGFKIRLIFSGTNLDDPFPHCTLLGMRASNVCICENTGDWSWQVTSPFIDPGFNMMFGKKDILKYGAEKGFPLEKTRTCYTDNELHCGICLACTRRKKAFTDAGIKDSTVYLK